MLDDPLYQQRLGELTMHNYDADLKVKPISVINALFAEAMANAMQDQLWNHLLALYSPQILQAGVQNRTIRAPFSGPSTSGIQAGVMSLLPPSDKCMWPMEKHDEAAITSYIRIFGQQKHLDKHKYMSPKRKRTTDISIPGIEGSWADHVEGVGKLKEKAERQM